LCGRKEGGRLKRKERWVVNEQTVQLAVEINYLEATIQKRGGWNKQRKQYYEKVIRL
jgi:hypothetical protein